MKTIQGQIVDIHQKKIYPGMIYLHKGRIARVEELPSQNLADAPYILPGFVDAHIHLESSMMHPQEFSRHVLPHGSIACICDPHEIANVCGVKGIDYMLEQSAQSSLKCFFGVPSCVPSSPFETSGAELNAATVEQLLQRHDLYFLAEMMDATGVLQHNAEVWAKLEAAKRIQKPIDGHAPGLSGDDLKTYVRAGIQTDHECMHLDEAYEKIKLGMLIQIREGSAAKNFEALLPLLSTHPEYCLFCSDDKHPNDLLQNGHINQLVKRAVAAGYDLFDTLRAASLNPIRHYRIPVGMLQEGDPADFIVVHDLKDFKVLETWIDGKIAFDHETPTTRPVENIHCINQFNAAPIHIKDIQQPSTDHPIPVIGVETDQLYTHALQKSLHDEDVLKIVVYNRYTPSKPAVAYVHNFGLKRGALASSIAHDSHNLIAVGVSDEDIVRAINRIIQSKGGIVALDATKEAFLPLPIAGLMSTLPGEEVARIYQQADRLAKEMGSTLDAPFMTLAFLSLTCIPQLKISDKGLFDGVLQQFIS